MPIENEVKFILDPVNPEEFLNNLKKIENVHLFDVTQGYLTGHARIRRLVDHITEEHRHVFTYKTKVSGKTVEIETDITLNDYEKLWDVVQEKIVKTRVVFHDNDHHWDIDFFTNPKTGKYYLIMAECELPEFMTRPARIPDWINNVLLSEIGPLEDAKWKNKKLANPKKVAKQFNELKQRVKSASK